MIIVSATTIGAMVPRNAVARAARYMPHGGLASKSEIVRHSIAIGVGLDSVQAMRYAKGGKGLTAESKNVSASGTELLTAQVPDDLLNLARECHPGKSNSWILRYYLTMADNYANGFDAELSEEIACEVADMDNRRKKSS